MAIVINSFSDLYEETHIQSVYNVIGRNEDYILRRNKFIMTI